MRIVFVFLFLSLSIPAQKKPNVLPIPENITEYKNLVYATYGERQMKLDLYVPQSEQKLPLVILIHGGGWANGSKEKFQPFAVSLAKEGFAVANIGYRLSGEAKFPGAVEDTKASIRWARAHADKYNIDSKKIFGVGGSAGGHLISMAALSDEGKYEGKGGNNEVSSKIGPTVILGSGVDQYERVKAMPNRRIPNCVVFLGEFAGNEELYKEASPHYHLSKGDPPIFMLDGEKDKPGERYPAFIKKMNELGIKNHFEVTSVIFSFRSKLRSPEVTKALKFNISRIRDKSSDKRDYLEN